MTDLLGSSPVANAFLTSDGQIFCTRSKLLRQRGGDNVELLREFPGASRGTRSLFVSVDGSIFASPEGHHLPDSEKGLWRCQGGGNNWHRVIDLSGMPNPVAIWALCAASSSRMYAGVYTTAADIRLPFIYTSWDNGQHWEECYRDSTGRHIHGIATDEANDAVYATIGDDFGAWRTRRVIRSVDHGATWQEILSDLPQVAPVAVVGMARLFGSDSQGRTQIYRTTDDKTWTTVLSDPTPQYFFWMRSDPISGELLAGTVAADHQASAQVYRSWDQGLSWTVLRTLDASNKWDGTAAASNIHNARIVIPLRFGGLPQCPLIIDLKHVDGDVIR